MQTAKREICFGRRRKKENIDFNTDSLQYPKEFMGNDGSCRYMKEIHAAMSTKMPMPSWDDILILGAQLNPTHL